MACSALRSVGGFSHHFEVGLGLDQSGQTRPNHRVIIHQEHTTSLRFGDRSLEEGRLIVGAALCM